MPTTIRGRAALVVAVALVPAAVTTTAIVASADASTAAAPVVLRATMGPEGDPNGEGSAVVRLNKANKRVCAVFDWSKIQKPQAGHIHQKSDDAVVVDLTSATVDHTGCTSGVKKSLIKDIVEHPRRYYVQLHNAKYPTGAIRGTLHR